MSTVLVVESESGALKDVVEALREEQELSVLTALGGAKALELLGRRPVELVITDGVASHRAGVPLLAQVKEHHPGVSRILMADDLASGEEVLARLGDRLTMIVKPLDAAAMRRTVLDTLERRHTEVEADALMRFASVTRAQIDRALRIRSRLQEPRPLGRILVETGALSEADYERMQEKRRVGMTVIDLLLEQGTIGPDGIRAYHEAKQADPQLDDRAILVEGQLVTEEQYLRAFCAKHGVSFVVPEVGLVDTKLLGRASFRYLSRNHALPVRILEGKLQVILASPLDVSLRTEIERIFGVSAVVSCSTRARITEALHTLERLRGNKSEASSAVQYHSIEDLPTGDETGEEAVQIVDYLLVRAIQLGASDLHIEPQKTKMRVRVRVDGILGQLTDLPLDFAPRVVSRIKVLAKADIAEKRLHQDGRIFVMIEGREIDIRMSSYVSTYGETLVLRLLDRSRGLMSLESIGFAPKVLAALDEIVLATSSGLVLITGPTGSGKTSTLYSFVSHANDPSEKVITAEDPVEYVLDGVVQCSVNQKTGPTFADSLRAIVRQDPDTIVVGEIRDKVTASLALEAALTGHKVFSTFHTEEAVGAITRLLDMDSEPFLVSSTIAAIVAQRLVRRVCERCRRPGEPARKELRFLGLERSALSGMKVWESVGCAHCDGTGYKGRIGVHEVLIPDDDFRDAIVRRKSSRELREHARKLPEFLTLQEDGLLKVAGGLTTLSEIIGNVPRDPAARPFSVLKTVVTIGRIQ